jgi:hypothetical protein
VVAKNTIIEAALIFLNESQNSSILGETISVPIHIIRKNLIQRGVLLNKILLIVPLKAPTINSKYLSSVRAL